MAHIDDVIEARNRATRAEAERDEARAEHAKALIELDRAEAEAAKLRVEVDQLKAYGRGMTEECKKLREEREEIEKLADHYIPPYAYGDNEAACEFVHRLDQILSLVQRREEKGGE